MSSLQAFLDRTTLTDADALMAVTSFALLLAWPLVTSLVQRATGVPRWRLVLCPALAAAAAAGVVLSDMGLRWLAHWPHYVVEAACCAMSAAWIACVILAWPLQSTGSTLTKNGVGLLLLLMLFLGGCGVGNLPMGLSRGGMWVCGTSAIVSLPAGLLAVVLLGRRGPLQVTSLVVVEIAATRERVAELMADPANAPKWMDDLARWEPLSGEAGRVGSTYRLVPKKGDRVFVATVLSCDLPSHLKLKLDGTDVVVSVEDWFVETSPTTTRLISEEIFRFRTWPRRLLGLLAQFPIRGAHRRHVEAFKRWVESGAP